jgi:NADH:ubiquinone oxidoreductase subunit 4 (subunit M)
MLTSVAHGYSSCSLSPFAGLPINKTYSRNLDSFCFLDSTLRILFLFLQLANLSFPGSFNSTGEPLALISIGSIASFYSFTFIISRRLSLLYWFLISNRKLTYHSYYCAVNWIEFIMMFRFIIVMYGGILFIIQDFLLSILQQNLCAPV